MGRVQIGQERRMNAHAQLCILHAAGRSAQADWNTLLHRAHKPPSGMDSRISTVLPGRVPAAAAERLDRMKFVAGSTPALRRAAAQHRMALHVRRAQAVAQVESFGERLGAARHAAHARAVT